MNKRFVAFIFLGLILVGVAEWDLEKRVFPFVRKIDKFWVDFCIGNAGDRIGNPSITMVRITDETIPVGAGGLSGEIVGDEKALTQLDYGAFLSSIAKMNPKAVSFMPTPVFKQESVLSELNDAALRVGPRMTLGTVVSGEGEPNTAIEFLGIQVIGGDTSAIPEITRIVTPPHPDLLNNGNPAFTQIENVETLVSGNPRIQLVARQGDKVVPSFVLASVAQQAGISPDQISIEIKGTGGKIRVGERYKIPIAKDGTMNLPSHGGLTHSMYQVTTSDDGKEKRVYHFASLKVEDVALAAEKSDSVAKTIYAEFSGKFESLANNLVLLGIDKTRDRTITTLNDEYLSPMTASARAIATIQSGRHTQRWPIWARAIAYGVIFLLALLFLRMRKGGTFFIIGTTVIAGLAMVFIFSQTLTWTPPTGILSLFVLMFLIRLFSRSPKPAAETTAEDLLEEAAEAEAT